MKRRKSGAWMHISSLLLALLCGLALNAPAAESNKNLIEFGWDEPSTAFLRQHLAQMETLPFDGCVFHVQHKLADGTDINLTWNCWGHHAFTPEELKPALEDLTATRPRRLKENFLRFNVTPGDLDWFEDFSAILSNARAAGRLARAGHARGILFDVEPYMAPVFDYRKQRDAARRSFSDYEGQVRRRGRELMMAFTNEFPDTKIFLTFGYSIAWVQSERGKKPLAECQYGLLPALLDGMVEVAGKRQIVDGDELAYSYKDTSRFERDYQMIKHELLSIVAEPEKYQRAVSVGFGVWLDNNWRKLGWNTNDLPRNYYDPMQFENSVRAALVRADEYVWIYAEQPRWWTAEGKPASLPVPYIDALRRVH